MSSHRDGPACLHLEEALHRSIFPSPSSPRRFISLLCDCSFIPQNGTDTRCSSDAPELPAGRLGDALCRAVPIHRWECLVKDPRKTDDLGNSRVHNLLPKAWACGGQRPGHHLSSCFVLSCAGRNPALDRPRHIACI